MAFEENWTELTAYLNKWYYKPDTEGLLIVLCTYLSHFYLSSPPVWLMIIGLPGSGKTEIGIRPISKLGGVEAVSRLTVNSFLSGFGDNNGILSRLTKASNGTQNGVITFPDLTTTLLSEDYITRTKIMGEMRSVYDGEHSKDVGNKGKKIEWRGKITCIAASTPDIEEHWAMFRDMGERWLSIRWGLQNPTTEDIDRIYEKSIAHEGHEKDIATGLFNRISTIINQAGAGPDKNVESRKVKYLAILLEESRVNVNRTVVGSKQEVVGVGNKQFITRSSKCINMICKASAALRGSDVIEDADLALGYRVALQSIPSKRWKLIDCMVNQYPSPISKSDLIHALDYSRGTTERIIEDLRYLKILHVLDEEQEEEDIIEDDEKHLKHTTYGIKKVKATALLAFTDNYVELLKGADILKDRAYRQESR